jgi:hypothetical protein
MCLDEPCGLRSASSIQIGRREPKFVCLDRMDGTIVELEGYAGWVAIVEPNYSEQRVRVGNHDEKGDCDKKLKFFESNILIKLDLTSTETLRIFSSAD